MASQTMTLRKPFRAEIQAKFIFNMYAVFAQIEASFE